MKILMTGATGFLGYRTIEKLADRDEIINIIANGREIKSTHYLKHPKVQYKLGDVSDAVFTNKLVEGVDTIINAASLSSPWGNYKIFETANVQTQINLINAAKNNNINRFIYISSPGLYFEMKDKFNIRESDPLPAKFINAYAETKRKAEILLEESQLSYVILRPRALIGRGDTVIMPRLIRAFNEGKLRIIGSGKNLVDLTSVSNVVDAIILSLKCNNGALNNIYNISNGNPVVLWEAISLILSKQGKELPKKKIPFQVARIIAQILEFKSRLTNGKEPVFTQYTVGTLAKSFTMDISKAEKLLGYVPKINTLQAIDEFSKWFLHEKS